MSETSLQQSIQEYIQRQSGLEFLEPAEVERIAQVVAEAFVREKNSLWWWDALKVPAKIEEYGEGDGLDRVRDLLGGVAAPLTMVITDDDAPPWSGVRGCLDALLQMLRAMPYFEYFIIDRSSSWVLFDTHHNTIVFAGDPPR